MTRNFDAIAATFTIIFLGMAFSAYVFVKPVTTIILIIGGVLLCVVALYSVIVSIAERKDTGEDQPALTVLVQEHQEGQAEAQAWQGTDSNAVDETREGIGLSAYG